MKKINLLLTAFLAMMLTSCKPTVSSQLDDTEAFLSKWETELKDGPLTADEKKELLKESAEINERDEELKKEHLEPTQEEVARSLALSERTLALFAKAGVLFP